MGLLCIDRSHHSVSSGSINVVILAWGQPNQQALLYLYANSNWPTVHLKATSDGSVGAKDKEQVSKKIAGSSDKSKKSSTTEAFASEAEAIGVCNDSEQGASQDVLKLYTQVSRDC